MLTSYDRRPRHTYPRWRLSYPYCVPRLRRTLAHNFDIHKMNAAKVSQPAGFDVRSAERKLAGLIRQAAYDTAA